MDGYSNIGTRIRWKQTTRDGAAAIRIQCIANAKRASAPHQVKRVYKWKYKNTKIQIQMQIHIYKNTMHS